MNNLMKGDPMWLYRDLVKKNPNIKAIISNLGPFVDVKFLQGQGLKDMNINHNQKYTKYVPLFLFDSIDKSVLFTGGGKHKEQRKLLSKSFDFQAMREYIPEIQQTIKEALEQVQERCKKDYIPVKICKETVNIAGDIGVKLFFGESFGTKEVNGKPISLELSWLVDKLVSYSQSSLFFVFKRLLVGDLSWKINWMMTSYEKEIINRANNLKNISQNAIEERVKFIKNQKNSEKPSHKFLDVLIYEYLNQQKLKSEGQSVPKNQEISIEEIHQQSLGMHIASADNTGIASGMILYCLVKYQEECQKVREEINKIFGEGPIDESMMNLDNINKLDYTHAFIKECMRHHSSSTGQFIRKAVQEHQVDGIQIQKNMMVQFTWYAPFNNPNYYPQPEKFDVNNFYQKEGKLDTYAWTPFSVGPYNCIGMQLSLIEVKILMIHFLKKFEFKLNPDVKLIKKHMLTLQPINDELVLLKSL